MHNDLDSSLVLTTSVNESTPEMHTSPNWERFFLLKAISHLTEPQP